MTSNKIDVCIQPSWEIFVFFVMANILGFNEENNPSGMCLARREIRKIVLHDVQLRNKIINLNFDFKKNNEWLYLKKIVSIYRGKQKVLKSKLEEIFNYSTIQYAWVKYGRYFDQEYLKIVPFLDSSFFSQNSLFKNGIEKVIIIPNLLDSYWSGYAIKDKRTAYIIVGPGSDKKFYEVIRHEACHLFPIHVRLSRDLFKIDNHKKILKYGYSTSKIIREEYIVRARTLLFREIILNENIDDDIDKQSREFPNLKKVVSIVRNKIKSRLLDSQTV